MAKHAKNRARPAAIRAYLTAGVTGAAFAGLGAFLAVQDATPATTQYDIKLVSNEEDTLFLSLNGGSDRRDREQRALAAQEVTDANPALRPMFGDGGWLIGNGLDAVEGCEGAACNGGDGGLLGGDGGNGLHGGKGGDAGWWFGNGGHGGDGFASEGYAASAGGDGGSGGYFFGFGGDGGDAGDGAVKSSSGVYVGYSGGDGGRGGAGFGTGGNGGAGSLGPPVGRVAWV